MSVYVPARIPAMKAGPLGPGAGVLMTEFPLSSILGKRSPQEKMRRAWELGISVPWIRAAERAISGACSTVEWHLEDGDDTEIDDEYTGTYAQEARALIERPSANLPDAKKLTRRELWALTFRHMGLCGNAFWYLDQQNVYGIPAAIKYLRPDRMSPVEDKAGNLLAWAIDKTPNSPGIVVPITAIIQFVLDPPDVGHFGTGLVETALLKAQNSVGLDSHLNQVIQAGGRMSGILGPKAGESISNDQYNQLVNDARTITEQPNAAQRLQIVRGPVDFTQTTLSIKDLQLTSVMTQARDDLLALWGVPLSQIASVSMGMNSGESHKVDRQAFWENANHPRIVSFVETVQYQLLDFYTALGTTVELEIDEPTFEDDGPRFDLLAKSLDTPLRNWERRELIGKEPFGEKVLNELGLPVDDEIWLPSTQVRAFVAPEEGFQPSIGLQVSAANETGTPEPNTAASNAAGETAQPPTQNTAPKAPTAQKASLRSLHSTLVAIRKSLDERFTPRVKQDVAKVLQDQKREVIARSRGRVEHLLENKGRDLAGIWDDAKWNRVLTAAMKPHLRMAAEKVSHRIRAEMPAKKAGPVAAVERALTRGGTRITGINNRTRDAVLKVVRETVATGIAAGKSPAEVGDDLEAAIEGAGMDGATGIGLWDEYRAEMIARTEMTASQNDATLGSYEDIGVTEVEAIDGDDDEECAARDGQTFTLDEADQEAADEHPNGTLDFVPILPDEEG